MLTFLIIIHVFLCLALIFLVLLQQGKGADLGAVFGNSNSVFGTSGGDNIGKITTILAIVFMVTSILLVRAFLSEARDPDIINQRSVEASEDASDIKGSVLNDVKLPSDDNANEEAKEDDSKEDTKDNADKEELANNDEANQAPSEEAKAQ